MSKYLLFQVHIFLFLLSSIVGFCFNIFIDETE